MKRIAKKSIIPLILIGLIVSGLVGISVLEPARAAYAGGGVPNISAKAYTAGVTANRFVKFTTAGVITPAVAAGDSTVGICAKTAAANGMTSYTPPGGEAKLTAGEAVAVGDLLCPGLLGKAYVLNHSLALAQRAGAIALTAGAADATIDVIVVASEAPGLNATMTAVTGAISPSVNDSGTVYNVTADAVITLPSVAAGVTYTFVCDGPDTTVQISLSPAAADKIQGMGAAGVANKDRINTKATAARGDYIIITGGAATIWSIVRQSGTWAAEG